MEPLEKVLVKKIHVSFLSDNVWRATCIWSVFLWNFNPESIILVNNFSEVHLNLYCNVINWENSERFDIIVRLIIWN